MQEQTITILSILIPALPLLGFFIHIIGRDKISNTWAGIHATLWVAVSFLISVCLFMQVRSGEVINVHLFNWFSAGDLTVPFAFTIDRLSIIMMLVITGVGSLIHMYSIGYMHGDAGFNRFFSYLNLFVFFMLMLVMANNYVLMFVGWEGVGLCSYLLIGFWFKNQDYNKAANKAFIMNRIGDLAMLLGIFLMFKYFGSVTYAGVFGEAANWVPDTGTITAITVLLFIGATGKSAQIPLYTWLPDAMAGPTPVSALIHAATMVTAGIYMIVRSNILFTLAPDTQTMIWMIGLATTILAGLIACKQNDIKKVLAYSTVSQLGLMFFALGLGAYEAGFFHLVTHAFFKALLFLGAGAVIHALGGEQDIRKMGGLRKHMKTTHLVFLTGVLAIIALPPFSGFFSKDGILLAAFTYNTATHAHDAHNYVLWAVGLGTGLLTAFYMMRMYFVVFFGSERSDENTLQHIHPSPMSIQIPLIVLAVLAVVGGLLDIPSLFGGDMMMMHFLGEVVPIQEAHVAEGTELALMAIGTIAILLVVLYAASRYMRKQEVPESDSELRGMGKVLNHKFYVDVFYQTIIVQPARTFGNFLVNVIDALVIDGIVTGTGRIAGDISARMKSLQTGNVSFYLFVMALGMAAILCLIICI